MATNTQLRVPHAAGNTHNDRNEPKAFCAGAKCKERQRLLIMLVDHVLISQTSAVAVRYYELTDEGIQLQIKNIRRPPFWTWQKEADPPLASLP